MVLPQQGFHRQAVQCSKALALPLPLASVKQQDKLVNNTDDAMCLLYIHSASSTEYTGNRQVKHEGYLNYTNKGNLICRLNPELLIMQEKIRLLKTKNIPILSLKHGNKRIEIILPLLLFANSCT